MHLSALLRSGLSACTSSYSWCSWTQKSHENLPIITNLNPHFDAVFEALLHTIVPCSYQQRFRRFRTFRSVWKSSYAHHLLTIWSMCPSSLMHQNLWEWTRRPCSDSQEMAPQTEQSCKQAQAQVPTIPNPEKLCGMESVHLKIHTNRHTSCCLQFPIQLLSFQVRVGLASGIFIRPCEEWLLSRYNNYCRERKYIRQSWENSREGAQQNYYCKYIYLAA